MLILVHFLEDRQLPTKGRLELKSLTLTLWVYLDNWIYNFMQFLGWTNIYNHQKHWIAG